MLRLTGIKMSSSFSVAHADAANVACRLFCGAAERAGVTAEYDIDATRAEAVICIDGNQYTVALPINCTDENKIIAKIISAIKEE